MVGEEVGSLLRGDDFARRWSGRLAEVRGWVAVAKLGPVYQLPSIFLALSRIIALCNFSNGSS